MQRCDAHKHGPYVTYGGNTTLYHVSQADFQRTICGGYIMHPYDGKHGTVINYYEGGTPFQTFHETIPKERKLCSHCKWTQERQKGL